MEDNRSVVERYVAALPADLDTLTSLQHPDFVEGLAAIGRAHQRLG
jgi:hypothetical protein